MANRFNQDSHRRNIIAANMIKLMEFRGVSCVWVAEKLGMSSKQIERYRNAQSEPTALTIYHFCTLLGGDVYSVLLSGEEHDYIGHEKELCPCEFFNNYAWTKESAQE